MNETIKDTDNYKESFIENLVTILDTTTNKDGNNQFNLDDFNEWCSQQSKSYPKTFNSIDSSNYNISLNNLVPLPSNHSHYYNEIKWKKGLRKRSQSAKNIKPISSNDKQNIWNKLYHNKKLNHKRKKLIILNKKNNHHNKILKEHTNKSVTDNPFIFEKLYHEKMHKTHENKHRTHETKQIITTNTPKKKKIKTKKKNIKKKKMNTNVNNNIHIYDRLMAWGNKHTKKIEKITDNYYSKHCPFKPIKIIDKKKEKM